MAKITKCLVLLDARRDANADATPRHVLTRPNATVMVPLVSEGLGVGWARRTCQGGKRFVVYRCGPSREWERKCVRSFGPFLVCRVAPAVYGPPLLIE